MFARDDETAALLREATACKDTGDLEAALRCLRQAKERMLESPVSYPIATWCRLPAYLMKAGRLDEAERELRWLLDDLPRRAAKEYHVDDPAAYRSRALKLRDAKASMKHQTQEIKGRLEKLAAQRLKEKK